MSCGPVLALPWWGPIESEVTPLGTIGQVEPGALVDLRRAVLRDGRSDVPATYSTDALPSTLHLGLTSPDGAMHGGVTVRVEPWPGFATLHLVLMAVDPGFQRQGVGRHLVRSVQAAASSADLDIWAAARVSALDFYRALEFRVMGDVVTGAMDLPHRRVLWRSRPR